jgi:hypothetical protein
MSTRKAKDPREGVLFGVILVIAGVVFLLDRMDVIYIGRIWQWWPLVLVGMGLFKMVLWHSAETVSSGLNFVMFGLWFLVSVHSWFGLHWGNSWPLALVAVGISMVARAVLEPLFRSASDDVQPGGGSHA